jgi:hypothetical protein
MELSDVPFSSLRRFLVNLDFSERKLAAKGHRPPGIILEHPPSDTIFIFRNYADNEKVHWPDLISVRKQLDYRGLLPADSFDSLLLKKPA